MLMPDYHTVQRHAQDRIARCQREAAHAQGDMRNVRQGIAKLLHQLANTLEPTSQPHPQLHSQLDREVYANEGLCP